MNNRETHASLARWQQAEIHCLVPNFERKIIEQDIRINMVSNSK